MDPQKSGEVVDPSEIVVDPSEILVAARAPQKSAAEKIHETPWSETPFALTQLANYLNDVWEGKQGAGPAASWAGNAIKGAAEGVTAPFLHPVNTAHGILDTLDIAASPFSEGAARGRAGINNLLKGLYSGEPGTIGNVAGSAALGKYGPKTPEAVNALGHELRTNPTLAKGASALAGGMASKTMGLSPFIGAGLGRVGLSPVVEAVGGLLEKMSGGMRPTLEVSQREMLNEMNLSPEARATIEQALLSGNAKIPSNVPEATAPGLAVSRRRIEPGPYKDPFAHITERYQRLGPEGGQASAAQMAELPPELQNLLETQANPGQAAPGATMPTSLRPSPKLTIADLPEAFKQFAGEEAPKVERRQPGGSKHMKAKKAAESDKD